MAWTQRLGPRSLTLSPHPELHPQPEFAPAAGTRTRRRNSHPQPSTGPVDLNPL